MKGPSVSDLLNSGLDMFSNYSQRHTAARRASPDDTGEHALARSRWIASFAHISPTNRVTKGAYFLSPSNKLMTKLGFPPTDCAPLSGTFEDKAHFRLWFIRYGAECTGH